MIGSVLASLFAVALGRPQSVEPVETDRDVLRLAVRGTPSAVRLLTRRLNPVMQARILRVLRKLTPGHLDDAGDVLQAAWVALLKDGGRQLLAFDPARGISLEAYAGMIAEREVRNHIQHQSAQMRRPDDGFAPLDDAAEHQASSPTPEEDLVGRDLEARLLAHLEAALPPKGQAVFRLIYTDGRSVEDTARMLGANVQVVYNWQHRVRTLAREFLASSV